MKLSISVALVIGAVLLGAGQTGYLSKAHSTEPSELVCAPESVTSDDVLTLRMRTPHGKDLAVIAPDGTFFFLVLKGESQTRSIRTNGSSFAQVSEIELPLAETVALPYVYGAQEEQIVFSQPGKYTIRLSENLETHDGPPVFECTIEVLN